MFKIASVSGAPLQTPLGELTTLPRPPSRDRGFLPSAITVSRLRRLVKSSQIAFIALKIRKIGEASADTAATETYYMKGYYNLEEETSKVKI